MALMAVWMESCSHFSKSSSWVVTFIINIMQHFAASLLFILHDPSSRTVLSSIKLLYFVSESFLHGLGKLIKNILYLHWLNLINDTVLLLVITWIPWIYIKVYNQQHIFIPSASTVNLNFPTILWKKFNPLCYLMSWCRFLVPCSWFLFLFRDSGLLLYVRAVKTGLDDAQQRRLLWSVISHKYFTNPWIFYDA